LKLIVDNLAIEYQDEGSGPVMLMLHGWQDNLRTFDPLMPSLINHWRVVRLDLPGFGGSEHPPTWNLDDYVNFVAGFVTKLHLDVDILVGHSLGGRIAIKGVADSAFKPKRLVLIASAGIAKSNTLRNQAFMILAKTGKAATAIPPFSALRHRLRRQLYARAGSDYLDAGPLKQTFLNIIAEDLQTSAAKLTVPTLLIWGDADTQTPLADGRRLSKIIPDAKLEVISNAGHFVHHVHPNQVTKCIRDFSQ
jgi:pimeloyl-ACP methyl ester carboxylesterase